MSGPTEGGERPEMTLHQTFFAPDPEVVGCPRSRDGGGRSCTRMSQATISDGSDPRRKLNDIRGLRRDWHGTWGERQGDLGRVSA